MLQPPARVNHQAQNHFIKSKCLWIVDEGIIRIDIISLCNHNLTLFIGSCVDQGYNGCCDSANYPSCFGDDGICYCDQVCYLFGDCCNDIQSIGCYASKELNRLVFVLFDIMLFVCNFVSGNQPFGGK